MTTKLSARESLRVAGQVVLPILVQGVIKRRPTMMALSQRLDTNGRAVRVVSDLRDRYGSGPLLVPVPGRPVVLPLTERDVARVLEDSPEPFSPASREKRAALGHFEPEGVLVSAPADRPDRRRFNEAVLDTDRPVHSLGARFSQIVAEEIEPLRNASTITWKDWEQPFWHIVRRMVLGDGARDDDEILDILTRLRREANWAFLWPVRRGLRARLIDRLQEYLDRAEPGSLAAHAASAPAPAGEHTAAAQQLPQWLFAFDAAAMASFRALALLASHPDQQVLAHQDTAAERPFLRACVHEALRLWPTTPMILRDTTQEVTLGGVRLSAGTAVGIFAPFLHRDPRHPWADRFEPSLWSPGGAALDSWSVVPFSGGPVTCPGRNLVLLLTTELLAGVLRERTVRLVPGHGGVALDPARPLPGTLDPFGLVISAAPSS
jgi:cytochrome P450